jgi:hypothetical protein
LPYACLSCWNCARMLASGSRHWMTSKTEAAVDGERTMAHRAWNACRCVVVSVRNNLESRQWDRHWLVTVHGLQTSPVTGACTAHEQRARDMSHSAYAEADLCPKPEVNRSLNSTGEDSPVPKARRG